MTSIFLRFSVLFFIAFTSILNVNGQEKSSSITYIDSTKVDTSESVVIKRKHSPKVASYLSAVLPGAGQVFNGKIWKVPVIYAGFAVGLYFRQTYNHYYHTYDDLYNVDSVKQHPYKSIIYKKQKYDPAVILEYRNKMRKNRDFTTICLSAWYILNIVDACVDAYLFDYDISDNLSINIKPSFYYLNKDNFNTGIALRFYVRK